MSPLRRIRGFTLLEAMVAVLIVATSGMALYAWLGQMTATVTRAAEQAHQDVLKRSALDWLRTVNPWTHPQGELNLGELHFRYQSQLLEQAPMWNGPDLPPGRALALYRIVIDVEEAGVSPWSFSVEHSGYAPVSDLEPTL